MFLSNTISNSPTHAIDPRVTIGLPVYNGERWLAEAVDSLLGQTYCDFRLIISDNGSTDATQRICEEYVARDTRIHYVRHEANRGVAWNWNWVFEISRSEYFKWAACDDVYHPTFLESCVEVLEKHPEVVWCHTRSRHIDANGKLLMGARTPEISYVAQPDGQTNTPCRTSARPSDRFKAVLLGRGGCLDCHGVIRTETLRETRLYLPYFGSEKVLMSELALRGRHFEVPESLYDVRIHEQAAGNLRMRREQRHFIDPVAKRWKSDRLGLLFGYLDAVHRAELPLAERLRCYSAISQYLLQVRKWKSVIQKVFTGEGLTGPYPSVDKQSAAGASDSSSSAAHEVPTSDHQPEMETVR
jgi:glycosyltransferase involved in cell wall biosynthesis